MERRRAPNDLAYSDGIRTLPVLCWPGGFFLGSLRCVTVRSLQPLVKCRLPMSRRAPARVARIRPFGPRVGHVTVVNAALTGNVASAIRQLAPGPPDRRPLTTRPVRRGRGSAVASLRDTRIGNGHGKTHGETHGQTQGKTVLSSADLHRVVDR